LSCAYKLAENNLQVIVLERGDFPGSKNVTGGRIYLLPVEGLARDMLKDAPFERKVVSERWSLLGDSNSLTLNLSSDRFEKEEHSYTVLRSTLDRWLSERLMEKGVFVIPKYRVDDLLFDNNRVTGVRIGNEEIPAKVVVAADGALSFMAQKAGLIKKLIPKNYAVGIKEVIEFPEEKIEDRFNLDASHGAAQLFLGDVTKGMFGGGFLYTNKKSISLGLVVGIKALMSRSMEAHTLMDAFKERPEIKPLIRDGVLAEYSAHVIPEAGYNNIPKLYAQGILLTGDAAGLAFNMGATVRGMEFAVASGIIAAETIIHAKEKNDYSAESLSLYEQKLKETFVLKDLASFKNMPSFLENEALFSLYPKSFPDLLEKIMWFGKDPKETFFRILKSSDLFSFKRLKDLYRIRNI
ncbi:MAG: FAD-dependent oxidoreductase, partial [Syntrophobacterales bacterium]|nr:FAD-dependent oxidoreductase [Syntrophobacterales bacterium]